jgi:hypothetical protein
MFVAWNGAILGSLESISSGGAGDVTKAAAAAADLPCASSTAPTPALAAAAAAQGATAAPASAGLVRVEDPLAALSAADPAVNVEISAFSFLAVATSFIGFVLGLTDFFAGALGLPSRRAPLPYLLALAPPVALAVSFPGIFLQAIDTAGEGVVVGKGGRARRTALCADWSCSNTRCAVCKRAARVAACSVRCTTPCATCQLLTATRGRRARIAGAGTYGVLTLFGLLPCAMAWVARYRDGSSSGSASKVELVPGGKPVLLLIAGAAAAVIGNEVVETARVLL